MQSIAEDQEMTVAANTQAPQNGGIIVEDTTNQTNQTSGVVPIRGGEEQKTPGETEEQKNETSSLQPGATSINVDIQPTEARRIHFRTGKLGIKYQGNAVTDVSDGSQAKTLGVQVGWVMKAVNDSPVPNDADVIFEIIAEAAQAEAGFDITFEEPSFMEVEGVPDVQPGSTLSNLSTNSVEGSDHKLSIKALAEHPALALGRKSDNFVVMARIKAPWYQQKERAAIDLVVVLDVSGSMSGERLTLAKQTLEFVLKNLTSKDRLGLVTYSSSAQTVFPLTRMDTSGRRKVTSRLRAINPGGCTNIGDGLQLGVQELMKVKPADVSCLYLFTDGQVNEGPQSANGIIQQAKIDGRLPCVVSTFGFGGDHDATLLTEIANQSEGSYYYVESTNKIAEFFADALGGLISTIGKKLSLQIIPAKGVTIKKVLTLLKHSIDESSGYATVEIGDIQSEETKDTLLELQIPATISAVKKYNLIHATVSYNNVLAGQEMIATDQLSIERPSSFTPTDRNTEVDEQYNRWTAEAALAEATKLAEANRFQEAQQRMRMAQAQISSSRCYTSSVPSQMMNSELSTCKSGMRGRSTWRQEGQYRTNRNYNELRRQRNNCGRSRSAYYVQNHFQMTNCYDAEMYMQARANTTPSRGTPMPPIVTVPTLPPPVQLTLPAQPTPVQLTQDRTQVRVKQESDDHTS